MTGAIVLWTAVATSAVVGIVATATTRRRRRQQLIRIYENPGAVDVVKAAQASHHVHRAAQE